MLVFYFLGAATIAGSAISSGLFVPSEIAWWCAPLLFCCCRQGWEEDVTRSPGAHLVCSASWLQA